MGNFQGFAIKIHRSPFNGNLLLALDSFDIYLK